MASKPTGGKEGVGGGAAAAVKKPYVKKKKCPPCKKGTPLWFVSWADMVTLLLCLFVIIVAYSSTASPSSAAKFKELSGSLRDAFGNRAETISPVISGFNVVGMEFMQQVKLVELVEQVKMVMSRMTDNGTAEMVETDEGFIIDLQADAIFEAGTQNLRDEFKGMLTQMANIIAEVPNDVRVIGYPGKGAVGTPEASLWQQSTAYALPVAEFLSREGLDPRRIQVLGQAQAEPVMKKGGGAEPMVEMVLLKTVKSGVEYENPGDNQGQGGEPVAKE